MASYVEQIKAANPEAYAQLAKLAKYSADEAYGGNVQDWQAQIFTPLSEDILKKAPTQATYDPSQDTALPRGTGFKRNLGEVNGLPIVANYDRNGNLSGYIADQSYRNWLSDNQSVGGAWDTSGKPAPEKYTSGSGSFVGGVLGDLAGSFGGYAPLLANLVLPGSGTALSLANAAVNGGDLSGALKNAAISYAVGQSGIGGDVAAATDSQALGQIASGTTSGLLSGQDLESSLTNAAINTGANQAAGSVLSAGTPSSTQGVNYTSGANYDLTQGQNIGGLGLQGSVGGLDPNNPYAFNPVNIGGQGLTLGAIGFNLMNNITGKPLGQDLANLTTGAENYLTPQTPTLANPNPAAQSLLAGLFKSFLTDSTGSSSTGTANMATTTENNAALSSLLGGLLGGGGNLLQGSTNVEARQAQADALRQAGLQAQQQATFKPVGTTTRFGTSSYTVDPTTGAITADYSLSPLAAGYQESLAGMTGQGLMQGQQIQSLAGQYLGESPEAVRQRVMQQRMDLLAPSRERELAKILNTNYQTGTGGLSVGATGLRPGGGEGLRAANPRLEAYYNSLAQSDLQSALEADKAAQQQITFGTQLAGQAYDPFKAGFGAQGAVETAGQQPLTLSQDIAKLQASSGAQAGQLGLGANVAAANAILPANQYNPYASLLSGAAGSPQLTGALGSLFGKTGVGSSLGSWLSGLGGYDYSQLNTAASDWMAANPDIIPQFTDSGNSLDYLDPETRKLLGLD